MERLGPEYFKAAYDLHPRFQPQQILYFYKMALGESAQLPDRKPLMVSEKISVSGDEEVSLKELDWQTFLARQQNNPSGLIDLLKSKDSAWNKVKKSDLTPEYSLFAFVFDNGVLPILDSESFKSEYATTKASFLKLTQELIFDFNHSLRGLFTFHAGEVFKVADVYSQGKTLGITNAAVLKIRNLVEKI